jgi:PHD/YefM family antitoxin component YafN of YafNO toxin-antitoxin module
VFCTFKGIGRRKEGDIMRREMSITEARHALTSLPERLAEDCATLTVTRRGEPVLAVMRWDLYESIVETLEIMGDGELMAALRQGIKQVDAGEGISWEQAKRELGV